MDIRTDLAVDIYDTLETGKGKTKKKGVNITTIKIETKEEEERYQKPAGTYITVEFPSLFQITGEEKLEETLEKALKTLITQREGPFLLAGLGNTDITADSIGPKTAAQILATRHIAGDFAENMGLHDLKSVAVIAPGVLGKTGIETVELIKGAIEAVKPAAVIIVDALASNSVSRLFQTVQLCDSGIAPGSGVKNARKELNQKTLGVPVFAVGIPTVMDASTLAAELTGKEIKNGPDLIITPKDSDLLCEKICDVTASSLNRFLQPSLDKNVLEALL